MRKTIVLYAGITAGLLSGTVLAADAEAGKAKAAACGGCHGADGISTNPAYPSLAGKDAASLSKAMKEYRSGERDNALMQNFMKPLSDADIDNIAAYYAGLPGK